MCVSKVIHTRVYEDVAASWALKKRRRKVGTKGQPKGSKRATRKKMRKAHTLSSDQPHTDEAAFFFEPTGRWV